MQPIQFFAARAEDGALVPNATVDVFVSGTPTRAALFLDSLGNIPLGNPFVADKNARVFFYTSTNRIDVHIHRGGYSAPLIRDIVVTDPDDVLALTNGVYRTVAQGLAATVSGKIFQVLAPEDEAAYAIYQNVSGVAVDTGKRIPTRYLLDRVEASARQYASAAEGFSEASRTFAEAALAYAGRNFGPLPSDPSVNPLGQPLVAGDRYFNTTLGIERVFSGIVWLTPNADGQQIQAYLADPNQGAALVAYRYTTVRDRLDQVLSLRAMGANGLGNTDDTELLVDAFSRTHIQIDTGGPSDVYFLRHNALLALVGENRLQVRDGVQIIGQGRVNILSNQLADGTRIELTGDRCYVGAIEIREINAALGRYNHYGALSARGATNFTIDRTRVTGSNGAAIHIRNNCQNFLIRRPYIRNAKSDGLHIQRGSRDFAIENPDIRMVEDDCIGIVGHGKDEGYAAPSNGVIVGGYYGEQQNGAVGSGIALIGCHDIQVMQPIIRRTGLSGIRIAEEQSDGLYTPRNITIVAPDIDRTGLTSNPGTNLSKEGIFISAGYKIDVINPKIQRAGTHGIAVSGPNVDVHIYEPAITDSGSRGMWLASSAGSGEMVTEIWGDDPRGVGAAQVRNEYLRLIRPRIDRSGTDGFYLDGTSGAFVEPELTDVKVRRSNMGGTANKYGIFLKDANGVCYSGLDAGSSGSGTALLAPLQFAGANTTGSTGFIDNIQTRMASLTIPLQSKYGIREFWNTTFPAAPTGVEGGYKVAETIRNPNPSNGVVRWVCTVAGDPGTWVAK
ncbi:MAG: right-handed parallel beta-helix repeat-containing protein [Pseudomonas sp.]